MERTLKSTKKVSHTNVESIRRLARRHVGRIVVVRTVVGTFTGCLLSAHRTFLRLRVFNPVIGRFVILRIPYALIIAIVLFRCRRS
ncbi:hypothetical protein [Paenibacillus sedimenti]|uniref:Uncharacterized protein n=1 Tax=Paenibacillus sedimenti TaxID=2770274 RepID=A0A926KKE9_9BACL|nr:hypothetical protein [Paenibacillus sedimenti]MBD0379399.1 hypothetical protein [Paenibacillus sedimenti]